MPTYQQLQSLSPEAYSNPANFVTVMDAMHNGAYQRKQYEHGLEIGRNATSVHIAVNSVWSARMKDGGHLSSYEGIGYHACTADLLRGFIDSGVTIVVHRLTPITITETRIQ